MPSSHLIPCRPLLLLPPIPPSIRVFSNESTLPMRCPKYKSFSFSIIPSKEIPGLIFFRMGWLDLFAVQGTQESSPTPQFKEPNLTPINNLASKDISTILTTNALQYTKNKTSNELTHWKRLLRVPWTSRRSNQSFLKEMSPECSLGGLMLKLKLQYFGHLM